jgi:alpha-methylacyl-CoA racemase
MCSWYLRGLGADVIKVEDPRRGDYLRSVPPLDGDGVGVWFSAINAGCRSVALDLKDEAGRTRLHALLRDADVLLEGFRPGVMDRLGLGPETLQRRYPRLVVASITGFGQTGPMKHAPGHDLGYCGLAGTMALGALHDGVPDVPGVQVADLAGGALTAALRITAALLLRARSGRGSHLDISMTEGVLPFALPALAQAAAGGVAPRPGREVLTGGLGTYRAYRCADGRLLTVAAIEPKFLSALQAGLGPEVALTPDGLAVAFAMRDRDEWLARLDGACVEPVLDPLEVLSHPLHRERGAIRGEGRAARVVPPTGGPSVWLHEPAPQLGEHTAAVLAEVGCTLDAELQ